VPEALLRKALNQTLKAPCLLAGEHFQYSGRQSHLWLLLTAAGHARKAGLKQIVEWSHVCLHLVLV
jgi:hypothetical protein